jgi:hypothetical protein
MHITFAARATFAEEKLLAIAGEIGEELGPGVFFYGTTCLFANFTAIDRTFEVRNGIIWLLAFNPPSAIRIAQLVNHRSNRNLYDFVRRIFAMHFFPAPVAAAFRLDNRLIEKMSKVVCVLISLQDNIAAASAVTPIRAPSGNEFFPPETDTPPSALSGLRKTFDAIDQHDARHCHREPTVSSLPRHLERKRGTPRGGAETDLDLGHYERLLYHHDSSIGFWAGRFYEGNKRLSVRRIWLLFTSCLSLATLVTE